MGTAERREYFLLFRNCSGDSLYSNKIEILDPDSSLSNHKKSGFDSKYMMVMQVQMVKVGNGLKAKGTMVHSLSWKR